MHCACFCARTRILGVVWTLEFYLTVVYCDNSREARKKVWEALIGISLNIDRLFWMVMGNFNEIIAQCEGIGQGVCCHGR